jgi:hypothetical protein
MNVIGFTYVTHYRTNAGAADLEDVHAGDVPEDVFDEEIRQFEMRGGILEESEDEDEEVVAAADE